MRILSLCALAFVVALGAVGCGHSDDEWNAQLAKYDQLKKSDDQKMAELQSKIDDLSKQLKDLGVDLTSTKANLADQAKALAEYQARAKQLELIKERFEKLKQKLDELTKLGLTVNVRHNRMVISLPGDVLFDSGKETLKKEGKEILLKVAGVIKADPQLLSRDYQVAGHTDNKPLAHGPFKDNWGLSVMRAREVLVYLVDPDKGGGLPLDHWSATGFADTDPIGSNDTDDGRQKNRRCELIVSPSVEEMLDLKTITQQ